MSVFKTIETQEQLNEVIKDRIARAEESAKKKFEGYMSPDDVTSLKADYDSKINALNDKVEKFKNYEAEIAEKDREIKQYETDSLKVKAAHEFGLSAELASRITGEDKESIMKDAELLSKLVGSKKHAPMATGEKSEADKGNNNNAFLKLAQSLKGD